MPFMDPGSNLTRSLITHLRISEDASNFSKFIFFVFQKRLDTYVGYLHLIKCSPNGFTKNDFLIFTVFSTNQVLDPLFVSRETMW